MYYIAGMAYDCQQEVESVMFQKSVKCSLQYNGTSTLSDVTKKYKDPAPRIWREISTTNKIKEDKTKNQLNT